jgi:hypothetical protein
MRARKRDIYRLSRIPGGPSTPAGAMVLRSSHGSRVGNGPYPGGTTGPPCRTFRERFIPRTLALITNPLAKVGED